MRTGSESSRNLRFKVRRSEETIHVVNGDVAEEVAGAAAAVELSLASPWRRVIFRLIRRQLQSLAPH